MGQAGRGVSTETGGIFGGSRVNLLPARQVIFPQRDRLPVQDIQFHFPQMEVDRLRASIEEPVEEVGHIGNVPSSIHVDIAGKQGADRAPPSFPFCRLP